jgi:chromodomain-helicase-DNA-binding protein 1
VSKLGLEARGLADTVDILTKNFQALSKGGTQQVSLMNIAMELKKAS